MNLDFSYAPTSIDSVHLGLITLTLVMIVFFLITRNDKPIIQDIPLDNPKDKDNDKNKKKPQPKPATLKEASPDAALQLLALLQQDARFIDFVKEDLSGHSDSDIGAVARVVHEGCQKTFGQCFELAPIRSEEEETQITLPEGFNASEVRLTGNVVGQAPFSGVLAHKGWRVTKANLPKTAEGHDATVVAPAEVEL